MLLWQSISKECHSVFLITAEVAHSFHSLSSKSSLATQSTCVLYKIHHHTRTLPSAAPLLLLNTYLLPLSVFLKGGIRMYLFEPGAVCGLRTALCRM